jgi:hypothetical protein
VVVTRKDLKPGYQIAQSGHAISQFILEHPELSKRWNNSYLISLSIDSEEKLQKLLFKLQDSGIPVSYFIEPDIGNQLTSICFLETEETIRLTSSLPLSLKEYK